jgi:hypothetical protein
MDNTKPVMPHSVEHPTESTDVIPKTTLNLLTAPISMKLRYHLTRLDVIKASIRSIFFNRPLLVYLSLVIIVVIGLSIRTDFAQGKDVGFLVFSVVFQLMLFFVIIVFGITAMTSLALLFGKGRGVLGEHEMEVSEVGLTERTQFNDSLHKWNGVTAVRETPGFYYIRVCESGGSLHVIPKKDRVLEGDLNAFISEIRNKIQTAHS